MNDKIATEPDNDRDEDTPENRAYRKVLEEIWYTSVIKLTNCYGDEEASIVKQHTKQIERLNRAMWLLTKENN